MRNRFKNILLTGILILFFVGIASAERLPVVGSDNNNWGNVINSYLNSILGPNATNLSVTEGINASGNIILPGLQSCDTIDTTANGTLICGSDYNLMSWVVSNNKLKPNDTTVTVEVQDFVANETVNLTNVLFIDIPNSVFNIKFNDISSGIVAWINLSIFDSPIVLFGQYLGLNGLTQEDSTSNLYSGNIDIDQYVYKDFNSDSITIYTPTGTGTIDIVDLVTTFGGFLQAPNGTEANCIYGYSGDDDQDTGNCLIANNWTGKATGGLFRQTWNNTESQIRSNLTIENDRAFFPPVNTTAICNGNGDRFIFVDNNDGELYYCDSGTPEKVSI